MSSLTLALVVGLGDDVDRKKLNALKLGFQRLEASLCRGLEFLRAIFIEAIVEEHTTGRSGSSYK